MTKEMFEEITAWQDATFTKATTGSCISHLDEEIHELYKEYHGLNRPKEKKQEFADCFMLLFGAAHKDGMAYDDICKAINDKMEINKQRKWGSVNAEGYVKHIPE